MADEAAEPVNSSTAASGSPGKVVDTYRDYANADAHVRRFYRLNHMRQTLEFARANGSPTEP